MGARHTSPDNDLEGDENEALKDLQKAHRLVRELWRACPDVLVNVMPQLEVELAADAAALRRLAVETIGDMVAGIGLAGMPELPELDPTAFPSSSITNGEPAITYQSPLLRPMSPKPFSKPIPFLPSLFCTPSPTIYPF